MNYKISAKRKDTNRWWSFGKVSEGKYGPQIGIKKTKEFMDYINSVTDGGYINFSLFEEDQKKDEPKSKPKDQGVPF